MGEAAVAPDLWTAIPVYEAYIQSIKTLKSEYDTLLAQRGEVEALKKKLEDDQQVLQTEREKLAADQKKLADDQEGVKADQDHLAKAQEALKADQEKLKVDRDILEQQMEAMRITDRERVAQIHDLLAQLGDARCQIRDLETKIDKLSKEHAEEIADVKAHLADAIEERDRAKRQNELYAQQIQLLGDKIAQLELDNEALKAKIEEINKTPPNPAPQPCSVRQIIQYDTKTNGNLGSWEAVANFYCMAVEDLYRLNPFIKGKAYNWDTIISVYARPQTKCC